MKFRLKYAFRKRTKGWFYAKTITQHSALPCHGDRTFPDRKNGKHIALTLKDGKYTFIMLASSVEIKAEFTVKQDMLFADVKPVDYFDEFVEKWRSSGGAKLEEEAEAWYREVNE